MKFLKLKLILKMKIFIEVNKLGTSPFNKIHLIFIFLSCLNFLSEQTYSQTSDVTKKDRILENKFKVTPEINLIAKVLLKNDYAYFENVVNLLETEGNNSYEHLSKDFDIFNEFIEDNRPSSEISDSYIFMIIAEKFKVVKITDWSGEDNQGDLKNLVKNSIPINTINWIKFDSLENKFLDPIKGYKNYQIAPNGRFLLHQFDEIIKLIKPYKVNLYSINDGSDNFNLFIIEDKEIFRFEELLKFKSFQSVFVNSIEDLVNRNKKLKNWKNL